MKLVHIHKHSSNSTHERGGRLPNLTMSRISQGGSPREALFTVCPRGALAVLSDGASWVVLFGALSLQAWALVGLWAKPASSGTVRGSGWGLEAVSWGSLWSHHVRPSPFGWVSPTGMTEHTKNLLRAFYELSQTHRGKRPHTCCGVLGRPSLPSELSTSPYSAGVAGASPGPSPQPRSGRHHCVRRHPGSAWALSRCQEVAIRGASREHLDQLVFCGAQSLVRALPSPTLLPLTRYRASFVLSFPTSLLAGQAATVNPILQLGK